MGGTLLERERMHAERLERLTVIHESRLQEASNRRSRSTDESDPRESVNLFLSCFSQKKELVEMGLDSAKNNPDSSTGVRESLNALALEVTGMEKLVAEAAYFLPSYEVRISQAVVAKLREEIDIVTAKVFPKKKFSFRSNIPNSASSSSTLAGGPLQTEVSSGPVRGSDAVSSCPVTSREHKDEKDVVVSQSLDAGRLEGTNKSTMDQDSSSSSWNRIEGKSSSTFVRDVKDSDEAEFVLSRLTDCTVYLRGRLRTLSIHSAKGCQIFSGPITGSAFIEDVEGSVLMLASHQIRIHSTTSSDFYLRVRSRPIIEYTSKVRFAPYAFWYNGVLQDLAGANLAQETRMWEKVDDFRWLRAVQSPNWSIIPTEERLHGHDGSCVVEVESSSLNSNS